MSGEAPKKPADQWGDLRTRVVSGVIVAVLGLGLLLSTGVVLCVGLSILVGLMIWELARLTGHLDQPERNERHARLTGLAGGLAFAAVLLIPGLMIGDVMYSARWAYVLPLVPLILGAGGAVPRNRWPFVLFFLGIYGGAFGILLVRTSGNLAASGPEGLIDVMWIVGTVVISDVLGYFAGRSLGGPKFWPAISPKKTWSGTVAGWIGAFLFALVIVLVTGGHDWWMLAAGPLIAFAGQMGDIAESWLKRRVGVKDSSNRIPGHGGVMDRFDAMTGAFVLPALAVGVTKLIFVLTYPLVGG